MSEGYTCILPHKKLINLGFFRGALFAEKFKILEGTGKNMSHVKIRSIKDAGNPTLIKLLKQVLEERQKALTIN